ncbi:winged helix-turn-helix domain-containing protein [Dyadobacter aurulentus]|uniref:winged helix-turn-helix domain-containing protein n=1 Tax=Dyadobacter sp. UC 10 TaxID=2605428 RepID=UPI0011F13C2B|nr:winged helix-turn-helix domain-containing protein [Dyadobacter sp. UC 10]KAA0989547.1 winged helix-turn-helix domain-containing protein [Dyadobacter sp. UC 10]
MIIPGNSFGLLQKRLHRCVWALVVLLPGMQSAFANNESVRFAEHVNLALRRTAHHLLLETGDSLTNIPPVKQIDANTFAVRVESPGEYGELPQLLEESFAIQKIDRNYNVMIFDCETGALQLGYNMLDLNQPGGVPCQTRAEKSGCYLVQVSFEPVLQNAATTEPFNAWWIFPFGTGLAGLGLFAWKRSRNKKTSPFDIEIETVPKFETTFGNSVFNSQNLSLTTGTGQHQLTYREAKLLDLFVRHRNQVLERDFILKSVWEDEGIIVGRSVDVFVSRLRKLLASDQSIKISAIHGVGYKMEIQS